MASAVAHQVKENRKSAKPSLAWMGAARALGVTTSRSLRSHQTIEGTRPSGEVLVDRVTVRGRVVTRYQVTRATFGPEVVMTDQTRSRLAVYFSGGDILVHIPAFDDQVIVQGIDPAEVRQFLTEERQAVVLDIFHQWPSAKITNTGVRIQTDGFEQSSAGIVAMVKLVEELVEDLVDPPALPPSTSPPKSPAATSKPKKKSSMKTKLTGPPPAAVRNALVDIEARRKHIANAIQALADRQQQTRSPAAPPAPRQADPAPIQPDPGAALPEVTLPAVTLPLRHQDEDGTES